MNILPRVALVLCALLVSACAEVILPQATPTVAPSRTPSATLAVTPIALLPSRTPRASNTATNAPTQTEAAQDTATLAASLTPVPTETPSPTLSPTPTVRPSNTLLPTIGASDTPTVTRTPSETPSQSPTPTNTSTPRPTNTLTPTLTLTPSATQTGTSTATASLRPSETATRTPAFTSTATLTAAPSETAVMAASSTATVDPFFTTEAPTWTPFPSQTPTVTVTITITDLPGPTLNATPEFATPAFDSPTQQPVASATSVPGDVTSETFNTPTPTSFPTLPPITPPPTIAVGSVLLTRPLGVTVGELPFVIGPGGVAAAPAPGDLEYRPFSLPNPRRSNERVFTDNIGALFWEVDGQARGLPGPFTDFWPESLETSDRLVTAAAWSADGTKIAFVIDNPNRGGAEDGVWWWDTASNSVHHVMHHCRRGVNNCPTYVSAGGAPYTNDPNNPDPYTGWYTQSVAWSPDGNQILARLRIGEAARLGFIVLPATADENFKKQRGPVCVYEYSSWAQNGGGVLVAGRDSQDQQVTGRVDVPNACAGFVSLVPQDVVQARVTPSSAQAGLGDVPTGVIEGSRFAGGQPVRVNSPSSDGLNLRAQPVIAENVMRYVLNTEQVVILAGPYEANSGADRIEWWQVQTYDRRIGWIAGRINGTNTLIP